MLIDMGLLKKVAQVAFTVGFLGTMGASAFCFRIDDGGPQTTCVGDCGGHPERCTVRGCLAPASSR